MARLTLQKKEDIKNALMLGDSQYKVAQDFEISSATVNKIFKEIDSETLNQTKRLVKEEISIKTVLSNQSESLVKAFDDKVNDEIRRRGLVFNASELLLKRTSEMLTNNQTLEKVNKGDGLQDFEPRPLNATDYKNLSDAIDKTAVTLEVAPRHANSQINIQNTNAQQNNANINIEDMSQKEISDTYLDMIKKK